MRYDIQSLISKKVTDCYYYENHQSLPVSYLKMLYNKQIVQSLFDYLKIQLCRIFKNILDLKNLFNLFIFSL